MTETPESRIASPLAGAYMEEELLSQPDMWARARDLAERSLLPGDGERVAIIGCGTSWFMAQSYAALREQGGHGLTDAYTASEVFPRREYDTLIALTRSGTTTEVLELVDSMRGRVHTLGIVADIHTPFVELVDDLIALPFADEQSVVQTRFATSALALLRFSLGESLEAVIAQGRDATTVTLDDTLVNAEQYTFLGSGWSTGLANEAALKMREASQSWAESYPAREYRHGPISIAAPGRVTWMLGTAPKGLFRSVKATGVHFENRAIDPMADLIRVQRVALARARRAGLNPDTARNLT